MRKLKKTVDVSGRKICIGDMVTTLSGDVTGKICDICQDAEVTFVRVRPSHQSYGQGVWHAADRTLWIAAAKPKPKSKLKTNKQPSNRSLSKKKRSVASKKA